MNDKNGFWQFDAMVDAPGLDENDLNDLFTFYIDEDEVVLRLPSISPVKWATSDNVYRLKAMFTSGSLLYLSPVGIWTKLADYEDGIFLQKGKEVKKLFKKITVADIPAWNQESANIDRPLFDYTLTQNAD